MKDLREWIAALEKAGELTRITTTVDPHLEVTEIADRVSKAGGPALLFERPGTSQFPLAMNLFGAARRVELALGRDPREIGLELVEAIQRLNPPSLGAFWASRGFLARGRHLRTREVRRAPVQEVAELGIGDPEVSQCGTGDAVLDVECIKLGDFIAQGLEVSGLEVLAPGAVRDSDEAGRVRLRLPRFFGFDHRRLRW